MKDDQLIRTVGVVAAASSYIARVAFVGNGPIGLFGYEAEPFAMMLLAVVVLALPETVDMMPFGPTRKK